jgi:hypothetical protein
MAMGDSRPSGDHLSSFNNYWDASVAFDILSLHGTTASASVGRVCLSRFESRERAAADL